MSDDFQALKARALKAREFTHTIGEQSFTLRMPTEHEVTQVLHRHRLLAAGFDLTVEKLSRYHLLCSHLLGWTGVRERDLLPRNVRDSADEALAAPLPWSIEAVPLYLDANPVVTRQLGEELMRRTSERDAALEGDKGN